MLLKPLFILGILLSFGHSIELNKYQYSHTLHGNADIKIDFEEGEHDLALENQDWIAIYKEGKTNEWKNVLHWNWVKDLKCSIPFESCHDLFLSRDLAQGNYEVRYFKNNSYQVDASVDLQVTAHDTYMREISVQQGHPNNVLMYITLYGGTTHIKPKHKDWIAIYKAGTDNGWENVVLWKWAKDLALFKNGVGRYWNMKKSELAPGAYEVRFFLNNSFVTQLATPFIIENPDFTQSVFPEDRIYIEKHDASKTYTIALSNENQNDKDWVAIFERGKERIKENIISWNYVSVDSSSVTLNIEALDEKGSYDLVYFKEDSYRQHERAVGLAISYR